MARNVGRTFINDLTGRIFGRLHVLYFDKERSSELNATYWLCRCECGAIKSIKGSHLLDGSIKSCGCYKKEKQSIISTKTNRIEFDENLGCLRVYFNNCDDSFLCDVEDRDIAESYCWYKDHYGYVVCNIHKDDGSKTIARFQRLVLEKYGIDLSDTVVDHMNSNKLDNRKFNLRPATYSENGRNKIYRPSNTGEKHIYNHDDEYIFQITIDGKQYRYSFNTLDEAIEYRNIFYKEHPDEFRYDYNVDYRNRNNDNIIYPFIFINPENN